MELHVVGLSGGKDSTALALRLAEMEPQDYVFLCTPTGDELPVMPMQHIRTRTKALSSNGLRVIGGA